MDILAAIKPEERKLEKQLGTFATPIEWRASGCKSPRTFH